MKKLTMMFLAVGMMWSPANTLPADQRTNGKKTRVAFASMLPHFQDHSAVFYDGRTRFLFGVVITEDGYLLTKASELKKAKDLSIRVGSEKYEEIEIVATEVKWDVALVKIDAENLKPVEWAETGHLERGDWVVSNGGTTRSKRRLRVGVISANAREIGGGVPVVLGVGLKEAKDGRVEILSVTEKSGAEEAGVKKGDVIVKADGKKIAKRDELLDLLKEKQPGQKIALELKRKDEVVKAEVELKPRKDLFKQRLSRNDMMSGPVSDRRDSFPRVIQHDTQLSYKSVGGPLFTLDGKCIGMNIAYANRVEIFAIPAEEMKELAEEMLGKGK